MINISRETLDALVARGLVVKQGDVYYALPHHYEGPIRVSGCYPTLAENPVLQGTLDAILAEKDPTCPCGIHRENCEYHRA